MAGKRKHPKDMKLKSKYELAMAIRGIKSLRNQALMAILYLTAARVTEIVGFTLPSDDKFIEKKFLVEPLKKIQIQIEEKRGKRFLIFYHLPVLKRRKKIKKKRHKLVREPAISRTIPINISREKEFVRPIMHYISHLKDDEVLFNISRQRVWQIMKAELDMYPHYLRHLRQTHLVTDYGFNALQLARFIEYGNIGSSMHYVKLGMADLIDAMM